MSFTCRTSPLSSPEANYKISTDPLFWWKVSLFHQKLPRFISKPKAQSLTCQLLGKKQRNPIKIFWFSARIFIYLFIYLIQTFGFQIRSGIRPEKGEGWQGCVVCIILFLCVFLILYFLCDNKNIWTNQTISANHHFLRKVRACRLKKTAKMLKSKIFLGLRSSDVGFFFWPGHHFQRQWIHQWLIYQTSIRELCKMVHSYPQRLFSSFIIIRASHVEETG